MQHAHPLTFPGKITSTPWNLTQNVTPLLGISRQNTISTPWKLIENVTPSL